MVPKVYRRIFQQAVDTVWIKQTVTVDRHGRFGVTLQKPLELLSALAD